MDEILNDNLETFDLVVFDLDNTLAKSKMPLDEEMAELLRRLLVLKKVSVESGAALPQYKKQFLDYLAAPAGLLPNLYLLPTSGASLYEYDPSVADWKQIYFHNFTAGEKEKIMAAFELAFAETEMPKPEQLYGVLLEDRETQITFSGLGSEAPLELKNAWDPDRSRREKLIKVLVRELLDFSVKIGGSTSIDVTKKGIDKAYGLKQLVAHLNIDLGRVVYVGDQLSPDGNDAPALTLGIRCLAVPGGPEETKRLIRKILDL